MHRLRPDPAIFQKTKCFNIILLFQSWNKKNVLESFRKLTEIRELLAFSFCQIWQICTAMDFWLHMIVIIWSKIGDIHKGITYPKRAATPLSFSTLIKNWLDLSKEVLCILVGQRAAKLRTVKVGGQKKTLTFWVRGYFFNGLRYPAGAEFEGLQLRSPLSYKDV